MRPSGRRVAESPSAARLPRSRARALQAAAIPVVVGPRLENAAPQPEGLMHPNSAFRNEDRTLFEALITETGFGMVFLTTPDGPRVAHVPLLLTEAGTLRFHLALGNALTRHLDGAQALAVVNGPDG